MKLKDRCKLLCTASAMIFLLGVMRGVGGLIDLINNTDVLIALNMDSLTLVFLIIILIFLSAAVIITAIGVYEQNEKFIVTGIALSGLFIVYSVVKEFIFYSNSVNKGTIINIAAAIAIISLLMLGKRVISKTKTI